MRLHLRFLEKKIFNFSTILFTLVVIAVLAGVFIPMLITERTVPGSSKYGFPMTSQDDYFQYIYEIKSGQEGIFLFHNVYTHEPSPLMILEPHYNIIGFLSKPFGLSPFEAYRWAKILALVLLVFCIYQVAVRAGLTVWEKIIGIVFSLFSTSVWRAAAPGGTSPIDRPVTYSIYFDNFTKFNNAQLHHFLAICALIVLMMHVAKSRLNLRSLFVTAIISVVMSFLHPYIAAYAVIFFAGYTLFSCLYSRKIDGVSITHTIVFAFIVILVGLYYRYLLIYVWKNELAIAGTLAWSPRGIAFNAFFLALGPLAWIGLPALFLKRVRSSRLLRFVALWGVVPFGLFFFPDIGLPMSTYRLFQLFQQIPLSLLAAVSIGAFASKLRIRMPIFAVAMCIIAVVYGLPSYILQLRWYTSTIRPSYSIFWMTEHVKPVLNYLEQTSPKGSVVMASELTSMIIPAFTHNRIIIGHSGTNPNYEEKKADVQRFLGGYVNLSEARSLLAKYNVSYIIFGSEALPYDALPYKKLDFLKEVYKSGNISLVAVNL